MADVNIRGAVVYTDGSANPNPGFYGSGVHGYTYVDVEGKFKATKTGSWNATNRGYILDKDLEKSGAKPVSVISYLDAYASGDGHGTNNLAEINAMTLFFEEFPGIVESIEELTILADSRYAINCITTWIDSWIANNWISSTGTPVSNKEAVQRLHSHVSGFRRTKAIDFIWVQGHNDEFGNVKADYLAGIGTRRAASGSPSTASEITPALGYHKVNVDLHPLIGLKRIYFNTDKELNEPGIYYQTGWSGNDFIVGKRTPEAVFSVVVLNNPDPIIEAVISAQYKTDPQFNTIVYAKMDRLRSPDVYPYLEKYGEHCLWKDKRSLNLNFLDTKPVTFEVRPGELPLRAIEVLNHLEELLRKFLNEYLANGVFEKGGYNYTVHDVTPHFYSTSEKKGKTVYELNKEFKVGITKTEVRVQEEVEGELKELKLPLVFQDDIPGRNTLKKLESSVEKVFVITWRESDRLLNYSTVIQTSDAIGIWSNHFANKILISAGS